MAGSAQDNVTPNATRPSAADNAYLVHRGYSEIEMGMSFEDNFSTLPFLLKIGLLPTAELGLSMSGLFNHTRINGEGNTELGDPGVQLKVQFLERDRGALAVVARSDFITNGIQKYALYCAASAQTRSLAVDITLGGAFLDPGGQSPTESLLYAAALSPKIDGRFGTYAELFGENSSDSHNASVDFGISFIPNPRIVLDAAIFLGISGNAPDWQVQAGLTTVLFRIF